MDILAVTHFPEINIQTFLELKSALLSLFVAWNENLVRFQVKWTCLPSRITLKLTFKPFLS